MPDRKIVLKSKAGTFVQALITWAQRHHNKLWWLHSLYALALGIGFMWLGKRNFAFLRVAVFHIGFIWLSTLVLPYLLRHPRVPEPWAPRLRLVINFLNKNLYQQMLFFVLPLYYASATMNSRNLFFVLLVGVSAILSTADIVYDRHLAMKRSLTAAFFAFNMFVLVNVMLPVVWSISNTAAMRIAGALAILSVVTLNYPAFQSVRRLAATFGLLLMMVLLVEVGRPFIPPAPLRLVSAEFGRDFHKESLQIVEPLARVEPANEIRIYALTAIKAPLGLRERLQHRWRLNGRIVCTSPFYDIVGGREEGFRLWTSCVFSSVPRSAAIRVDVETEGGQLIGRAILKAQGLAQ
jgi:hypothetical protein